MELDFLECEDFSFQTGGGSINRPSTSNQNDLVEFDVKENRKRTIKKYNGEEIDYQIIFNLQSRSNISILEVEEGVLQLFNRIIQRSTQFLNPGDLIRICVDTTSLDSPLSTKLMPVSEMTPEKIVSQIEKVIISGKKVDLDSSLKINILTIKRPLGSGRTKILNLPLNTKSKKSIIAINNQDELCCARAIVVAVAYLENDPRKKYISAGNKPLQGVLARELHCKANVSLGPCGHSEIEKFALHLDVQINVVDAQAFNKVTFSTPDKSKKIFLWLKKNHYDVITKMTGFLGTSYYCSYCDIGYKTKSAHRCKNKCPTCFSDSCLVTRPVNCPDCNKMCRSLDCFERHRNDNKKHISLCAQFGLCGDCYKVYKKNFPHICGGNICKFCKQSCITSEHLCFMRRTEI
ncbi:uncharacterized protein [Parasteatoda tepidariorum]|uniref:uncharacterized protein n=1 Tax=Parasteatoda tepidariorum TaxID=114398 RepID=UPI001C719FDD|nr:uncharacterized protein LOC122271788 [Parasteatoda tepidariorum]